MTGMVQGGWGFVIAAYGISWAVWLGYMWSLSRQSRAATPEEGEGTP